MLMKFTYYILNMECSIEMNYVEHVVLQAWRCTLYSVQVMIVSLPVGWSSHQKVGSHETVINARQCH
jgi:hypothetical protein